MYSPSGMVAAPSRLDRPIALVGLMGAGKSTVGKRLARRLELPFVDSDEEIERILPVGFAHGGGYGGHQMAFEERYC